MGTLKKRLQEIPSEVQKTIDVRLDEFSQFKAKSSDEWFSELCFCLLTANSKAITALAIQKELGFKGFSTLTESELVESIKRNKHRFHNTKAARIVRAREHISIKQTIQSLDEASAREWLVENIHGLGYKEASHFLRNVGYVNSAILDRHILALLVEDGIMKEVPQSLNRSRYMEIEKECIKLAHTTNMTLAKLDLSLWYLKTGKVFK